MLTYLIKRLSLIVPTLIVISVIAFVLSKATPQDPVQSVLERRGLDGESLTREIYEKTYRDMGMDRPVFYFSILPSHYPPSVNRVVIREDRVLYKKLLEEGIHYTLAEKMIVQAELKRTEWQDRAESDSLILLNQARSSASSFSKFLGYEPESISGNFFLPKFKWHGLNNQYHSWLVRIFSSGFGPSLADGKTALSKVSKAMQWTLSFTLIDLVLSIILGLSLGVYLAYKPQGRWQRLIRQILYFFYAIPIFWLATLLVVYFTTDDYGAWTNIFPSVGMDIYPGKSTLEQIILNADKLILPILCLSLHSMAYVTRMLENSLSDELEKDYVLLSYAMGMSKWEVIRTKVLRNSLIPAITLFVAAFAAAFSGSLVLEVIFNIPGMGRLLFNALQIADWNVVFCILIVLSTVTVIAYLLGDILYAWFNPRIKLEA